LIVVVGSRISVRGRAREALEEAVLINLEALRTFPMISPFVWTMAVSS
jgi:hypothetical protein